MQTPPALPALRATGLRKRLGARQILDQLDLTCHSGELLVLLGENGAGKSTLLRVLAGILEPEAGQVLLCGEHGYRARRHLGYVPDGAEPLPALTPRELSGLYSALRGQRDTDAEADALAERLGVTPVYDRPLASLSFGQRRRACLLAALRGRPPLALLDEPSNGLDPDGCALLATLLKERRAQGLATLLSTNDAALLPLLPHDVRALRLRAGRCTPEPAAPHPG